MLSGWGGGMKLPNLASFHGTFQRKVHCNLTWHELLPELSASPPTQHCLSEGAPGCQTMDASTTLRDQALSIWSGSTDSKALDYQRNNPREYQIVRTPTKKTT